MRKMEKISLLDAEVGQLKEQNLELLKEGGAEAAEGHAGEALREWGVQAGGFEGEEPRLNLLRSVKYIDLNLNVTVFMP